MRLFQHHEEATNSVASTTTNYSTTLGISQLNCNNQIPHPGYVHHLHHSNIITQYSHHPPYNMIQILTHIL